MITVSQLSACCQGTYGAWGSPAAQQNALQLVQNVKGCPEKRAHWKQCVAREPFSSEDEPCVARK